VDSFSEFSRLQERQAVVAKSRKSLLAGPARFRNPEQVLGVPKKKAAGLFSPAASMIIALIIYSPC
jgi:hypothetical protein